MKKTTKKSRRKQQKRQTDWKVIGGIVAISAVVLLGMIALAFREPSQLDLVEFCDNNPENCIAAGSNDATVRMVEVSDYGCPHCKTFNLETAPLLEEAYGGNEDYQYMVMPFALGGQSGYPTLDTAVAALCANEQDGFWDFHQATFTTQGTDNFSSEAGHLATAESIGLDMGAFNSCLADNNYEDIVRANIRAASAAGINSTPSFMLNGQVLTGAQPFTVFQEQIESLLNP